MPQVRFRDQLGAVSPLIGSERIIIGTLISSQEVGHIQPHLTCEYFDSHSNSRVCRSIQYRSAFCRRVLKLTRPLSQRNGLIHWQDLYCSYRKVDNMAPIQKKVHINVDLGEGYGNFKAGPDDELIPLIDHANIACGVRLIMLLALEDTNSHIS